MSTNNKMPPSTVCQDESGPGSIKDMRVFISYAHEDYEKALKIKTHLDKMGVHVLWDRGFLLGSGFHEQIKTQIAYSHVFMPIITTESSQRGWVHQEIGYAMALNIPVLPVAVMGFPEAMIGPLHSVMLRDDDDINKLDELIPPDALALLVNLYNDPTLAQYVCADESEDRAALFARYASEVRRLIGKRRAPVLQSSVLSSFHIPSEITSDPVWTDRHDPDNRKGLHHNRLQRRERLALQWHACRSGARLIIYPEVLTGEGWGELAAITRYQTLIKFLEGAAKLEEAGRGGQNQITIDVRHGDLNDHGQLKDHGENVTIVGDWFMATSLIGTKETGYRQTIFTRHAPTIREKIKLFEAECNATREFTVEHGDGMSSCQKAVIWLREKVKKRQSKTG